jgi:hypothetical protein
MMSVWIMSKFYQALDGKILPTAQSYCNNHAASGFQANGYGLVWCSMEFPQLQYLQSGAEPDCEVVGTHLWSAPTPLLLTTYADQLSSGTFTMLAQVLDVLGQTEPRFLQPYDPAKSFC